MSTVHRGIAPLGCCWSITDHPSSDGRGRKGKLKERAWTEQKRNHGLLRGLSPWSFSCTRSFFFASLPSPIHPSICPPPTDLPSHPSGPAGQVLPSICCLSQLGAAPVPPPLAFTIQLKTPTPSSSSLSSSFSSSTFFQPCLDEHSRKTLHPMWGCGHDTHIYRADG